MIGIFLSLFLHKKLPTELWQRMLFDITKIDITKIDITKINKDPKQEHYEQNRKTRRLSSNHR